MDATLALTCQRCLEPIGPDTPYRVWINTGKCRRCLIGRSSSGNECSWCLEEFWIAPKDGESHGICRRHEQEMAARVAARRELQKAPGRGEGAA